MVVDLFKSLFKETSWLEILNLFQMNSVRGLLSKVGIGKAPPSNPDGEARAEEGGKGNVDEHNTLIALAETHFGRSLCDIPEESYRVSRKRFSALMAIFKALREQNKPGGAQKLMHIIGHESHLHGMTTNPKAAAGQKPDGQPGRIDIENVRQRTNPAGKLIVLFLTSIPTQEAVDLLVDSSITENSRDKTAAAARAVGDKADETWQKIRKWWLDGSHDTRIHLWAARYVVRNDDVMKEICESKEVMEIWAAIQAEQDPTCRRAHDETLRACIAAKVKDHWETMQNLDPNDAVDRHMTRISGRQPTSRSCSKARNRLLYIIGGIIIAASLIKAGFDAHQHSAGTASVPATQQTK